MVERERERNDKLGMFNVNVIDRVRSYGKAWRELSIM